MIIYYVTIYDNQLSNHLYQIPIQINKSYLGKNNNNNKLFYNTLFHNNMLWPFEMHLL